MTKAIVNYSYLRTELVRKSIHFLIALSPVMAVINYNFTIGFLAIGILTYIFLESLRLRGRMIPLVSSITAMSIRTREKGHFVLGPVTLGLGALISLVLFPLEIAAIAILALAFGDGFASLIGKPFGRTRPSFMFGKSIEGSAACFFSVFIVTWQLTGNYSIGIASALTAAAVEALPLEDYDNIALPLAVGFIVQILMG